MTVLRAFVIPTAGGTERSVFTTAGSNLFINFTDASLRSA